MVKGKGQHIYYTKEDGSTGKISNISDNTPCHITQPDERSKDICVYKKGSFGKGSGDSETSMENCKNKDYKEIEEED